MTCLTRLPQKKEDGSEVMTTVSVTVAGTAEQPVLVQVVGDTAGDSGCKPGKRMPNKHYCEYLSTTVLNIRKQSLTMRYAQSIAVIHTLCRALFNVHVDFVVHKSYLYSRVQLSSLCVDSFVLCIIGLRHFDCG